MVPTPQSGTIQLEVVLCVILARSPSTAFLKYKLGVMRTEPVFPQGRKGGSEERGPLDSERYRRGGPDGGPRGDVSGEA